MFEYTLNLIGSEIYRLGMDECKCCENKINELKKAIKILRDGKGYLTADDPKRIIFYDDNAE